MAFHIIYFFTIFIYGIWVLALSTKNNIMAICSALLMFPFSIYIFTNGVDIFPNDELLCIMFAAVTFIIAVITSFQATYNMYKEM